MTAFAIPVRVYYEDTDAGGVVYYANYLKYMERARSDWLRALGFNQDELAAANGVVFAVRAVKIDFVKPARLDDLLSVTATIARRGGASLVFEHQVSCGTALLCQGEVKVACLNARDFVPVPVPDVIVAKLENGRLA